MLWDQTPGTGSSAESAWTSLDSAEPVGLSNFWCYTVEPPSFIFHATGGTQSILALVLSQIKVKSIWQILIEALQLLLRHYLTRV